MFFKVAKPKGNTVKQKLLERIQSVTKQYNSIASQTDIIKEEVRQIQKSLNEMQDKVPFEYIIKDNPYIEKLSYAWGKMRRSIAVTYYKRNGKTATYSLLSTNIGSHTLRSAYAHLDIFCNAYLDHIEKIIQEQEDRNERVYNDQK